MSILDRVTKAVGDAVDRGKKEVDQFVRIQKINSQIGDLEKSIGEFKDQILQTKVKIGEMAIEMLHAGTLTSQEMTPLLDQINGIHQKIASLEAEIKEKKAEIESMRSEDRSATAPGLAATVTPPPPSQAAASRYCPQCGAPVHSGTFCTQCGSKLA